MAAEFRSPADEQVAITFFDTSIPPCYALRDYWRSGILHFLSKQNTMHWSWPDLIPLESKAIPASRSGSAATPGVYKCCIPDRLKGLSCANFHRTCHPARK